MQSHNLTATCPQCEGDVEYEITPYDPGRASGPVELCYPPEGGEIEGPENCAVCGFELDDRYWASVYDALW